MLAEVGGCLKFYHISFRSHSVWQKLPVLVHPTNLEKSRTRPTAPAVGAGGVVWTFFL